MIVSLETFLFAEVSRLLSAVRPHLRNGDVLADALYASSMNLLTLGVVVCAGRRP